MTTKREDRMRSVYTQMETISRRAVARSRRTSEPLTVVQHTLLTFIAATPDCRAIDLAAALRLNRSTVSRQVGDLTELGLVEIGRNDTGRNETGRNEIGRNETGRNETGRNETGPTVAAVSRGQLLGLTDRGRELLDRSLRANHEALEHRLADWSDAEVDRLARGLERFNAVDD